MSYTIGDFAQRLLRKVRGGSQPRDQYRRFLLTGYGLISAMASAVIMHSQELGWGVITGMVLAPFALVAITRSAWSIFHSTMRHGAG